MAQEIFRRYEVKYLLTQAQYDAIQPFIEEYFVPDRYRKYTIRNVYYDTPDYELIRASIEKPVYKEKFRLRTYAHDGAEPESPQESFLEIKKKYDGIVYKRRIILPLDTAEDYLIRGILPDNDSQIFREIDWMIKRYRLAPKAYVAYDRIAFNGKENAELRLTFDTNIRCRNERLSLTEGDDGVSVLDKDQILMEIKIPGAMPLWMSNTFTGFGIFPSSFSKYGAYYKQSILKG